MTVFTVFPPVFLGRPNDRSNGNSNPFRIVMYANEQSTAAVLAQEMREFGLKWLYLHTPALLIAVAMLALGRTIEWGVAAFVVACVGLLASKVPPVARWLELHGHEVEVQAAGLLYNLEQGLYRLKEAETMQRGYGGLFKHMTSGQVWEAMLDRAPAAERYVSRRLQVLYRFQREVR